MIHFELDKVLAIESDEPDATSRCDDAHRRRMLAYVHDHYGGDAGCALGR